MNRIAVGLFFLSLAINSLVAPSATAQTIRVGQGILSPTTVGNLPTTAADGIIVAVTDGNGVVSCTTGGGTTRTLCEYDANAGAWFEISSAAVLAGRPRVVSDQADATCTARINTAIGSSAGRILVDESCTLTASIDLDQADTIFECLPEITLTKGFNGNLLRILAARITVRGCHLDANKVGPWTGSAVATAAADDSIVENCRIENAEANGINVGTSDRFIVRHNVVLTPDDNGIIITNNSENVRIHDNFSTSGTTASTDAIVVSSGVAATDTSAIVYNNTLEATSGFCVEAGAFTGNAPKYVIVEGNHCTAVASFQGGYSFSNVAMGAITGNTLLTNGQTGSIAGIEVATSSDITVSGNTIDGGTTLSQGMSIDQSSNILVDGNTINGWQATAAKAGIHLVAGVASSNTNDNVVSNNLIIAPATTAVYGIRLQANNASATLSRNLITGNHIVMNGVASSRGIQNSHGSGTQADNALTNNTIENAATGILDNSATGTILTGNHFTNTTSNLTAGSTTPYIQDMIFAHASLPAAADGSSVECTNCTQRSDPCSSGGSGSQAVRVNGAWVCGGGNTYFDSVNVASIASMTLPAGNLFHITGTDAITTMNTCDAANNGRLVHLIFDGILTFTDGNNLKLAGDFVTTADDAIQLICDGTNWYQTSPGSVN